MNQRRKIDMRMQKVCKIFRWCKMYSMGMTKFQEVAKDAKLVIKLVSLYLLIQKYWISILKLFILQILSFISR